jgi:nicotinate-nucleotide--dimethylbenzimidazole phosphoribosyltransferase
VVAVEAAAAAADAAVDDAAVDDAAPAVEDAVADADMASPSRAPWSGAPIAVRPTPPADATPDDEPAGAASTVEPAVGTTPAEDPWPGAEGRTGPPVEPEDPRASAAAGSSSDADADEPLRADRLAPGSGRTPAAGLRDADAELAASAADPDEGSVDVTAPVEPAAPTSPAAAWDSSSRLERRATVRSLSSASALRCC